MNSRDKLNKYFNRVDVLERELSDYKVRDAYKVTIDDTRKELEKAEALYKEAEALKRIKDCANTNVYPNVEQVAHPSVSFTEGLPYDYELELERQRTELEEAQLKFLQEKLNHQIEENIRLKARISHRYFHPVSPYHAPSSIKPQTDEVREQVIEKEVTVPSADTADEGIVSVSQDSIMFDGNVRLTFLEAYALLSPTQKRFCDGLVSYACKHSEKERRDSKFYVSVGCGVNQVVKILIKNNTVVVSARMEDYTLRNLRLSDTDTPIKTRETSVKVVDNGAYETAKRLIDLRIEQIAKFVEEKKLVLKEKRKASSTSKKKL